MYGQFGTVLLNRSQREAVKPARSTGGKLGQHFPLAETPGHTVLPACIPSPQLPAGTGVGQEGAGYVIFKTS